MDRTTRQKTNEEIEDWKNTIDQLDLTDTLHNTPPNKRRIHILLKYTWNILQDTS